MAKAFVSEIYASVQGEGPYTGEKQIFLRLAGCPLRCRYCDTPDSLTIRGHKQESADNVLKKVVVLGRREKIKTVSVTGGEPLVNVVFLENLLPKLRRKGFRIYLETAGVHPANLKRIAKFVDVISMDIKLPSATGRDYWKEHAAFLEAGGSKIFAKVVIDDKSNPKEVGKAIGLLKRKRKPPLLVLQPATEMGGAKPPAPAKIAVMYEAARRALPNVLVMPQQHKFWGVR